MSPSPAESQTPKSPQRNLLLTMDPEGTVVQIGGTIIRIGGGVHGAVEIRPNTEQFFLHGSRHAGHPSEEYDHFKIRRDMIVHEDQQISHRVTVTLMTQSILFTAAAVALTSSYRALNLINGNRIKFFVEILCGVGFFLEA